MPELPEVELHARKLRGWLLGRRILECEVLDPRLLASAPPDRWKEALVGQGVLGVRREAKYLLMDLAGGLTMVVHLRMTGKLLQETYAAGLPPKAARFLLHLDDGTRVRFDDFRRFGRVWFVPTGEERTLKELAEVGPDALREPTSAERLRDLARGARRSIKALLMDQRVLGGLGNICAIEILFRAGIAPATPAAELNDEQIRRIVELTPPYLEWAIEAQSHRELIYLGEPGAENVFSIYARRGEPCPRCATPIERSVIAGRGTYFCPSCQQ
jgi:formamidopyrimidine-DNA glycosylase